MRRLLFVFSIGALAVLLTSILAAIYATYWIDPGEGREGLGLLWYFTQPGTILLALLSAFLYRFYLEPPRGLSPFTVYLAIVAGVSFFGPLVGLALLLLVRH